MREHDMPSS
jgi:hypothetical protein